MFQRVRAGALPEVETGNWARPGKETADKLASLGHQVEVRGDWSNASAPTVIPIRPGVLDGGADPRRGRFIFGR